MKIGIYISGLGQSFTNESLEKYASRLINEMKFRTTGNEYEFKTSKIKYTKEIESNVVSIFEQSEQGKKVIYKIYDFKYHEILTEKFNSHPLLIKNLLLFWLVIRKVPLLVKRLFVPGNYNQPFQTLYLFTIFFIIASALLLMLPATYSVIADKSDILLFVKTKVFDKDIPLLSKDVIGFLSKIIVTATTVLLLIIPKANVLIPNLATDFVCANDYIERGTQRQLLQGNLELLVDYITENETDCKIHFHTYSFGSIIAIDYLFPFGNKVTRNTFNFAEALITIGTPFEFINSYYPYFYQNRELELGNKICWINIYSIADALATNFRSDDKIGDAQFGINQAIERPINLNYEVASINKGGIINFIMLYGLKAHGLYWDPKPEGQSCLRIINDEMINRQLI